MAVAHGPDAQYVDIAMNISAWGSSLRSLVDSGTYDDCVRAGAGMSIAEAVHLARDQIHRAREPERPR